MILFRNIGQLLTLKKAAKKSGRRPLEKDLSVLSRAAMIADRGKIFWVGPERKVPKEFLDKIKKEVSFDQRTVLPSFTECHTHLVFAGDRAHEFEQRNQGVSYQEIARKGGGILSTVKATRKARFEDLLKLSQKRVKDFLAQGVSTIEVKSGYGLRLKDELKMLEVARSLKKARIRTTYLGPHAVPPEFSSCEEYMDNILSRDLKKVAQSGLADRADIFIESGFFDLEIGRKFLKQAKDFGLNLTIHADQLNLTGAGQLGVELGAQSVDHLVQWKKKDIQKLSSSETVGVLLPAADYYLKMKYPPARKMIDEGARVALATDFNPGSSPTQDLSLVGLLSRMEMKMTLPEVITAYTVNAAAALGLEDLLGSLEVGKSCDFAVLETDWTELFYHVGDMGVTETWKAGKRVF